MVEAPPAVLATMVVPGVIGVMLASGEVPQTVTVSVVVKAPVAPFWPALFRMSVKPGL
jgi:hypothetical protein